MYTCTLMISITFLSSYLSINILTIMKDTCFHLSLTTLVWHFSLIKYEVKEYEKCKPINSLSGFKISKYSVRTYFAWKLGKMKCYIYLKQNHICTTCTSYIFSALFITQSTKKNWNVNQIIDYKYINRMKSIDCSFRYVVLMCIRQVQILITCKPW